MQEGLCGVPVCQREAHDFVLRISLGKGVRDVFIKTFAFSSFIIPDPSERAARLVTLACGSRQS